MDGGGKKSNNVKFLAISLQEPGVKGPKTKFFVTNTMHQFGHFYTVSQKKQDTKLLCITLPNLTNFQNFFTVSHVTTALAIGGQFEPTIDLSQFLRY